MNSYQFAVNITPSDTVDLAVKTEAVYVGAAGTLTVIMDGSDNKVLFTGLLTGTTLKIKCQRIMATGTSCTGIVALS